MDEDLRSVSFGLPRVTVPALVGAALLLGAIGLTNDTAGRIAGGVVAVLLLAAAGWVSRGPTLTADSNGVSVRGLVGWRRFGWSDVVAIGANEGRRARAVEFETADQLVVVSASLLGRTTATDVAEALSELWREFRSAPGSTAGSDSGTAEPPG